MYYATYALKTKQCRPIKSCAHVGSKLINKETKSPSLDNEDTHIKEDTVSKPQSTCDEKLESRRKIIILGDSHGREISSHALDCGDDSVFDFPPLVQSMRLNIEAAPMYPMYRGGRVGRAAAAYYREKEVMIAIKNKYGSRFGRRIQAYKPDTEAWRPERYQRHTDTLNSQYIPKVIPGGLQNKKPLINIHHHWLVQKPSGVDQQERFSQESHICDKYPTGKVKNGEVSAKTIKISETLDLAEPGRPSRQGRARMRGKRVVDISTIICGDELAVSSISEPEEREPDSNTQEDQGNTINRGSNQSPSKVIEPGDKEFTVESLINPEKREPEISIQKDKGNMRNGRGDQPPSELITSVENLSIL